jgi:hypothetical protein
MQFQFDSKIAQDHSVNEAVFIHNLYLWIKYNKANEKHFYEGKYWTYNTKKAFAELFPFWSLDQVKRIIDSLLKKGLIFAGNFNENSWDKTNWYSLSDEVLFIYENGAKPNKTALGEIAQSSGAKSPNRMVQNHPIDECKIAQSFIGTYNKTYNKACEGALAFFEINFPSSYESLMMQFKTKIKDFQKFRTLFDAKVETEKLEYDQRVLSGRFISFATNWIENEKKESKVIELYEGPKHKIAGF